MGGRDPPLDLPHRSSSPRRGLAFRRHRPCRMWRVAVSFRARDWLLALAPDWTTIPRHRWCPDGQPIPRDMDALAPLHRPLLWLPRFHLGGEWRAVPQSVSMEHWEQPEPRRGDRVRGGAPAD